jgi:N-acetyltransferase
MGLEVSDMIGRGVLLTQLVESHREGLRAAADDERIWVHTLSVARGKEFDRWFDDALSDRDLGARIPFTVQRLADGQLIGSTSYLDINLRHKRIEIGSTWYHPLSWGTAVNPECKLLLLTHAFELIRVNRVSLVTDARNERSQAAIAKLGAVREGVFRSHMVTQGERARDSVVFSIIAAEWPVVHASLLARLDSCH